MYTKKTVVYAVIEATPGSGVTPALATNSVMAYDVNLEIKGDMKERSFGNSDRSVYPNIRGKTVASLSFGVELKGSGSAGTAPQYAPLLRACDRYETTSAGTSVTYTPATTIITCSINVNIDGILHVLTSCAGDCEIDLTAGEIPMLNFTFSGIYALPTDVAVTAATFDATIPEIVKGTTTTFGAYSAIIEKLVLKFGNSVVERSDFNITEGVKTFMVGNRNPTGIMTCEAALRATVSSDFWLYFNAGTSKALSMVLGTTAGNIVTITAPACKLSAPKYGDRDGLRTFEVEFQMARSTGDDEMTIALT